MLFKYQIECVCATDGIGLMVVYKIFKRAYYIVGAMGFFKQFFSLNIINVMY